MDRNDKITTIQSMMNSTFDNLYLNIDLDKEKYLFDKLTSSTDEYLDDLLNSINSLKKFISKLKISGISLEVSYSLDMMTPWLDDIESTSINEVSIDFGYLNNGNIIVSSVVFDYDEEEWTGVCTDIRKLDMEIQSPYTLENILTRIDGEIDDSHVNYDMETIDRILKALKKFNIEYFKENDDNGAEESADVVYVILALTTIMSLKQARRTFDSISPSISEIYNLSSDTILIQNMCDMILVNGFDLDDIGEEGVENLLNVLYDIASIPVEEIVPIEKINNLRKQSALIDTRVTDLL
jgi:hypothetical protein